ncbi:TPR domain-containing protein [Cyclospora cayetanensis]|uniref:TPR domain-containing protein n=1 Tax=Cyclospora cayetanensis TaxID=88456 RepID=A0A1D3D3C6_9EIME|nr:TPR domain-containing protein [Cyclospora cayetanensis]
MDALEAAAAQEGEAEAAAGEQKEAATEVEGVEQSSSDLFAQVTSIGEAYCEEEEQTADAQRHSDATNGSYSAVPVESEASLPTAAGEAVAASAPAEEETPRFEELEDEESAGDSQSISELKERGNEEFRRGAVSGALHFYSAAIKKLEAEVEETETKLDAIEMQAEQLQLQQQEQEGYQTEQGSATDQEAEASEAKKEGDESAAGEAANQEQQQQHDAREHPAAHLLPDATLARYRKLLHCLQQLDEMHAVLKSNRALCHLHYGAFDAAVTDGSDAIHANPNYAKAYLRRFRAYEGKKKWHEALSDLNKAIELDPKLAEAYGNDLRHVKRESELLFEKEKEEMLGKLKDLGNFVLGKVGLSLDNFKVEQNPETGSYNIQFQQNPK